MTIASILAKADMIATQATEFHIHSSYCGIDVPDGIRPHGARFMRQFLELAQELRAEIAAMRAAEQRESELARKRA